MCLTLADKYDVAMHKLVAKEILGVYLSGEHYQKGAKNGGARRETKQESHSQ